MNALSRIPATYEILCAHTPQSRAKGCSFLGENKTDGHESAYVRIGVENLDRFVVVGGRADDTPTPDPARPYASTVQMSEKMALKGS